MTARRSGFNVEPHKQNLLGIFRARIAAVEMDAIIDTGSSRTTIAEKVYNALRESDTDIRFAGLSGTRRQTLSSSGTLVNILGYFDARIIIHGTFLDAHIYVARELPFPMLIGCETLHANRVSINYEDSAVRVLATHHFNKSAAPIIHAYFPFI